MQDKLSTKKNSTSGSRGNALIFVLLAVVLLGLLAAVLMRTSGSTEETGDNERTSIAVSKLMQYTSSIQSAIERMTMNGVSENDISFANDIYQDCSNAPLQGAGHNPNCTKDDCEIFNVAGGGVKPMETPPALLSSAACAYWKNGAMALDLKRVQGIGSDNNDELLLEVFGLTKEACMQVNRTLNIPNAADDAPTDDVSGGSTFSGTFTTFGPQIGNEYTPFIGKKAFCLKSGTDYYSFFTVLIGK